MSPPWSSPAEFRAAHRALNHLYRCLCDGAPYWPPVAYRAAQEFYDRLRLGVLERDRSTYILGYGRCGGL